VSRNPLRALSSSLAIALYISLAAALTCAALTGAFAPPALAQR
jgi:hypothetical protein